MTNKQKTAYEVAAFRALVSGLTVAGATFFSILGVTGDYAPAAIGAGSAFFSIIATRLGVEGSIDTSVAKAEQRVRAQYESKTKVIGG